MFSFCRDLGAFARKLSEGYFGHFSGKVYHLNPFSIVRKLRTFAKVKKREKVRRQRKVR